MQYLTEDEYAEHAVNRVRREPHRICKLLRSLRTASGMSLAGVEKAYGVPAVVLGAYERGDREPPLRKLDHLLDCYGYELTAVPKDETAVRLPEEAIAVLRSLANQLEKQLDDLYAVPEEPAPVQ